MAEREETDIIFGCLTKRIDRYTFELKIYITTNKLYGGEEKLLTIHPYKLYVNGVGCEAYKADRLFVDTTLIGKKAMFIVKNSVKGRVFGDLYRLPFGSGNSVKVPSFAAESFTNFISSEYKVAV